MLVNRKPQYICGLKINGKITDKKEMGDLERDGLPNIPSRTNRLAVVSLVLGFSPIIWLGVVCYIVFPIVGMLGGTGRDKFVWVIILGVTIIIGYIGLPLGVISGFISLKKIRGSQGTLTGRGYAKIGIIFALFGMAIYLYDLLANFPGELWGNFFCMLD